MAASPRLALRPLRRSDLEWFVGVRNSVRAMLHDSRQFSVADAESWFDGDRPDYLVVEVGQDRAGYFRLEQAAPGSGELQVGADLAPAFQGQGLGEQLYRRFLPQFADDYGARSFVLRVLPTNTRALVLYRKLGFTTQGVAARPGTGRSIEVVDVEMRLAVEALSAPPTHVAADFADLLVGAAQAAPEVPGLN